MKSIDKKSKRKDSADKVSRKIDLEELLNIVIDEEHWFLQAHQTRVAFYSSFISAVLAVTLAGFLEASKPIQFAVLMVGPAIVFVISMIAQDGTFRFYQ